MRGGFNHNIQPPQATTKQPTRAQPTQPIDPSIRRDRHAARRHAIDRSVSISLSISIDTPAHTDDGVGPVSWILSHPDEYFSGSPGRVVSNDIEREACHRDSIAEDVCTHARSMKNCTRLNTHAQPIPSESTHLNRPLLLVRVNHDSRRPPVILGRGGFEQH